MSLTSSYTCGTRPNPDPCIADAFSARFPLPIHADASYRWPIKDRHGNDGVRLSELRIVGINLAYGGPLVPASPLAEIQAQLLLNAMYLGVAERAIHPTMVGQQHLGPLEDISRPRYMHVSACEVRAHFSEHLCVAHRAHPVTRFVSPCAAVSERPSAVGHVLEKDFKHLHAELRRRLCGAPDHQVQDHRAWFSPLLSRPSYADLHLRRRKRSTAGASGTIATSIGTCGGSARRSTACGSWPCGAR